jgi:hypothetical protein
MTASREKDQADFDLERFIDMMDTALTSRDERVVNALRSLMMMVVLTEPETGRPGIVDRERGPLRRITEEIGHLNRRIGRLEDEARSRDLYKQQSDAKYEKELKITSMKMSNQHPYYGAIPTTVTLDTK